MPTLVRDIARELVFKDVTYAPFSADLIADGMAAYTELIRLCHEMADTMHLDMNFVRKGELDPDMGLISRRGEHGTDHKDFFHFSHDLCLQLSQLLPEVEWRGRAQLKVLSTLYNAVNDLAITVANAIDDDFGHFFTCSLEHEVRRSAKLNEPYATTTLRGLQYPPLVGQRGAKTHIDRSLFSVHFGDDGGQLYARNHQTGAIHTPFSIGSGEVALFRGVKFWLLSRRKCKPVWHYSTTVTGKPRRAMVQFIQARVPGMLLHNAGEAYQLFRTAK